VRRRLIALQQLERVYGIGPVAAKHLVDEKGIKSLGDLLTQQHLCVSGSLAVALRHLYSDSRAVAVSCCLQPQRQASHRLEVREGL
jgi:hypothetical protein